MTRIPRHVRKQSWKFLGYSSPRAYRLEREKQWHRGAPMRRAVGQFVRAGAVIAAGIKTMMESVFATCGALSLHRSPAST